MKTNIYVLRMHNFNEKVWEKFKTDFGTENSYMIFDNSKNSCPIISDNILQINETECVKINELHNKFHLSGSGYRCESHLIAISRFIREPFKYLWLIEYDVYCPTNMKNVLDKCDDIDCDFLSKGRDDHYLIRTFYNSPNWCWWDNVFGDVRIIPPQYRLGCFFPLNRFSVNMIKAIEDQLHKSTGFCEVYIPTLCVYYNLIYKHIPDNLFGVFRFQPNVNEPFENDKLYHPVKN